MPDNGIFPGTEAELNNYFITVVPYLIANKVRLGISAANITALTTILGQWNTNYPPSTNPNTRTKTITDLKNTTRDNFMALLRAVYADIAESVLIPADRNTLNLQPRSARTVTPAPVSRPVAKIDTSMRLQHTINFTDENSPTSRAKPARVLGAEIWVKIGGDAPADSKQCQYVATDTRTPYILQFDGADAGKPAYYMLRWVSTNGQPGPWSETVLATISA